MNPRLAEDHATEDGFDVVAISVFVY